MRRRSGTLGGLLVTDVQSLTTDNRYFSSGLISVAIGLLREWSLSSEFMLQSQTRAAGFCCSVTC